MKNWIIVILVVAVLGLGGWAVYDKTQTTNTNVVSSDSTNSSTNAADTPKSSSSLDLSDKGLTSVGPDIYNKTGTTTLTLSNNSIQSCHHKWAR